MESGLREGEEGTESSVGKETAKTRNTRHEISYRTNRSMRYVFM